MAVLGMQPNMGTADRLLRGLAGSLLFMNGLRHLGNSPLRKIEAAIGGAFLAYGVSGFDPLLSAFGATTIPGTGNNVWKQLRAALPGQGIKPLLTQYVVPLKPLKPFREEVPLAEALTVG